MTPTVDQYRAAFDLERSHTYPVIDAYEQAVGFAVDRARLERAAEILACPVKVHPPNWQHGRVLYAMTRQAVAGRTGRVLALDIGTAKGFTALVLRWALDDAGVLGDVVSVDVIDPRARVRRNTVAEVDGYKTITELVSPWPEATGIRFVQDTGATWLRDYAGPVDVACVDGKHDFLAVRNEGALLHARRRPGDAVLFDDVHIDAVWRAVRNVFGLALERIDLTLDVPGVARAYAIARAPA